MRRFVTEMPSGRHDLQAKEEVLYP